MRGIRVLPWRKIRLYVFLAVIAAVVVWQARFGLSGTLFGDTQHTFDTWGTDDGFIAFRYAWNFGHGAGLVYNVGYAPVEGYTSLGFVALLWPFGILGKAYMYPAAVALCLIAFLGFIVLAGEFAALRVGRWAFWPVVTAIGLCPTFWVWTTSGLETMLMAFLQMAVIFGVLRREKGGLLLLPCLAAAACVVMRADGFVLPLLLCFWLVWRDRKGAVSILGVVLVTLGALIVWRMIYYGWPLPNTAYAKVAGLFVYRLRNASVDFLVFLISGVLVAVIAAMGDVLQNVWDVLQDVVRRRLDMRRLSFEAVVMIGWLAYFFYVGGDVYMDRFLVFLVPLAAVVVFRLGGEERRCFVLVALLVCQASVLVYDYRVRFWPEKRSTWLEMGEILGVASHGQNWLLASDTAGEIPFASGLPTVDMLGLNDVHIAHLPASSDWVGHMKSDLGYVMALKPHWICGFQKMSGTRDLALGLDETVYRRAGYRIRFVGWSGTDFPAADQPMVWDVKVLTMDQVSALMDRGYGYVALEMSGGGTNVF